MNKNFRQAIVADIPEIMTIINGAKNFLTAKDLDQWAYGYPAESDIKRDIEKRQGHVLSLEDKIAGYVAVIFGEDPDYGAIKEGVWANKSKDYVTIHRLAMSDEYRGKGLTKTFWAEIFNFGVRQGHRDFRVDTDGENSTMQHILMREGFERRGLVYVQNGERIAYQKEID